MHIKLQEILTDTCHVLYYKDFLPGFLHDKNSSKAIVVSKSFNNIMFVFLLGRGEQLKDKTRIFLSLTNVY